MAYPEASRFATIYQEQAVFDEVQREAVIVTESALVGAFPDPLKTLAGVEKLSAPELASLREKITDFRGHLLIYLAAANELDQVYSGQRK